ncbi:MAG: DUF1700 domain-containing protein [Oligoflexus sp.]|nr:DUF1700 domain-containing protein [Oligoflexus sp.]
MTEVEFIGELSEALQPLSIDQREDILADYRSHFFEGKERGKSEEDIARNFGDPRFLARTYLADYHFEQWQSPSEGQGFGKSMMHLIRGLIVMLSLLFFNFFFILWPVLALGIFLAVAWIMVGVGTLVSGVFVVIGIIGSTAHLVLPNASAQYAILFYSLGTGVLSLLLGVGLYSITRLSITMILRYIKLNVNLVAA